MASFRTLALSIVAVTLAFAVPYVSAISASSSSGDEPIANTPYGSVLGVMDRDIYAFKGIPYAQPPIGKLRFAAPAAATPWKGVLNGTTFAPGCMQDPCGFPVPSIMCTPTVSEDCLYLNVYTPTLNSSANLPVIMFIHGGTFNAGSGGVLLYDGSSMVRNQNVVLVTINYRLGVFGALVTSTLRGNFMLQDQRRAMKWIRKSIQAFGGNPNLLTISGQSAGAISVGVHMVSPPSFGLFQRGISVSNPLGIPLPPRAMAGRLGAKVLKYVGCPAGGSAELACLRAANASVLLAAQDHTRYTPRPNQLLAEPVLWGPVVDSTEVPVEPLTAMHTGQTAPGVPLMFGTVANESVQFVWAITPRPLPLPEFQILIELMFNQSAAAVNAIYGLPPPSFYNDTRLFLTVVATDYIFYCPNRYAVAGMVGSARSAGARQYEYVFDKLPSYSAWAYKKNEPECVNEVCHADDLGFIFNPFKALSNITRPQPDPTPAEVELSHIIQAAWGNFARSGNPNPLPGGLVFPEFNATTNLAVNYSTPASVLNGYRNVVCDAWDRINYNRF